METEVDNNNKNPLVEGSLLPNRINMVQPRKLKSRRSFYKQNTQKFDSIVVNGRDVRENELDEKIKDMSFLQQLKSIYHYPEK